MPLTALVTPSFARTAKKLYPQDKAVLDATVKAVAHNPALSAEKRGDLNGVLVYKFKLNKQETLLAYRLQSDKLSPQNWCC